MTFLAVIIITVARPGKLNTKEGIKIPGENKDFPWYTQVDNFRTYFSSNSLKQKVQTVSEIIRLT
jgi:hypothetical protein